MKLFSFATLSAIAIASEGLPLLSNSTSAGAGSTAIESSLNPLPLTSGSVIASGVSTGVPSSAAVSPSAVSGSVTTSNGLSDVLSNKTSSALAVSSGPTTFPPDANSSAIVRTLALPSISPHGLPGSETPVPTFVGSNFTEPTIGSLNSTQPSLPTFAPSAPVNGSFPTAGSTFSHLPTDAPDVNFSQTPQPITTTVIAATSQNSVAVSSALKTSVPVIKVSTVTSSSSTQTQEIPTDVPTVLPTKDSSGPSQSVNTQIPTALTSFLPAPTSDGPEDDPSNGSGNCMNNGSDGRGIGPAGSDHGQWNNTSRFQLRISSPNNRLNDKHITPLFAGIGINNLYPTFFHAGSYSIEEFKLVFNSYNKTLNAVIVESKVFGNTTLPLVQVLPDVTGDSGFGFNYQGQLTVNGTGQFYACKARGNKHIKLPAIAFIQNSSSTQKGTLKVNGCQKVDILRSYH
ncbi:hypothetical protein TRVA0_013S01332 [Trichomonascus vanleenenianus]|uniref:uncharacterized protein n=1 Tax=Trichomonascus vanleenenianus TaxID=2268995 RepID=UPI003ECBA840